MQPRWPTLRWTLREAGVYAATAMVVGIGILIAGAIVLGNRWEPPVAIGTLVAQAIAAIAIRRTGRPIPWRTFPWWRRLAGPTA